MVQYIRPVRERRRSHHRPTTLWASSPMYNNGRLGEKPPFPHCTHLGKSWADPLFPSTAAAE